MKTCLAGWQVLSWHEVEFLKADKMSCFWLDDTGQGVGVIVPQRGEDDHLVRGAVRDGQLVAEPAVETFLWVSQLLPPIDPVPGDLTQAPVDSKPKRDWKYPQWIEKQNTRRHEYLGKIVS